jgi:predicted transcriptional regulator
MEYRLNDADTDGISVQTSEYIEPAVHSQEPERKKISELKGYKQFVEAIEEGLNQIDEGNYITFDEWKEKWKQYLTGESIWDEDE